MRLASRHPWLREVMFIPFVLAAVFWIFLGRFLTGEYSFATWPDNTHFILPLFSHISRSFAAGEFPYWIGSVGGGIPLYNDPQFSLLYPLYFFGWNLYRTPIDALHDAHYVTLLHIAILWLTTYAMLRIFRLRIISSILGATLFAFSANTYAYVLWVNVISPYSWFPLCLASVYLVLENKYPKAGLVLGAVSIYMLVSASPAHALIHLAYCAAFITGWYVVIHRKAPLRNLVVLAFSAVFLSSAVLVPALLFARRGMVRWTEAGAVVGNERVPFAGFHTGQAERADLAKVVFPLDIQPMTGDPYLGMAVVFLAIFGVFRRRQNWIVMPLLILGIYALLSSAGTHFGLAYINYRLPLLNKIREPGRHLYVFALAACTLAAFGFEHLTDSVSLSSLRSHGLALGSFLVILLSCYWIRQRYGTVISDSIVWWSFMLFLAVLCGARRMRWNRSLIQAALAAIVVFPSLYYPLPRVKSQDGDYFNEANLHSHRVLQELSRMDGIRDYRLIVADNRLDPKYWSMNASYYDLRTFETFSNPLPIGQVKEMLAAPLVPRYAGLLGAKYYLSCGDSPAPAGDRYSQEREIEGCRLYSTKDAQPHYFLSTHVGIVYTDAGQFLDNLRSADADLSKLSVSSRDAGGISAWLSDESAPLSWEASDETRSRNTFAMTLKTSRKSMLVLNEYFSGDWQATLNGSPQKLLKVNLNQIGLLLPGGTNQVRFQYRPRLFAGLLYLQWIAFAALAVLVLRRQDHDRNRPVRSLLVKGIIGMPLD